MNESSSSRIKKFIPHIVAVIVFTIVSFVFFYPVLEGKILKANDSIVSKVSSKSIADFREAEGSEPLWTNSMFGGMPAYLISTRHPGNLMKKIDVVLQSYGRPVCFIFISMLTFYIMLLLFGVNPWLAIIGALAYGFSPYLIQVIAAGHNSKAMALAYVPLVVGGIYYAYKKNVIAGSIILGLGLALEIGAGHPQITYYAAMCIIVMLLVGFVFAVRENETSKFIKTSLTLLIPIILAVGVNFSQLYTTYEYGKYSMRGKSDLIVNHKNASDGLDRDYITQWSYGIGETMNLLIPNFKGGSSKPFDNSSATVRALRQNNNASAVSMFQKYWGSQPMTEGPNYMGAIMVFLFVLGVIVIKGPEKWWLLIATVLSILLSWGHNFYWFTNLFIDYFPGYNKFRAVTMILTVAQFCIPLMGILALKEVFSSKLPKKELQKNLLTATGITGGVILLFILIPSLAGSFTSSYEASLPDWIITALQEDRKSLLLTDCARSLVLILLSSALIYAFISDKLKQKYVLLAIGLLVLFDLFGVDKRYLGADKFERQNKYEQTFAPTPADEYIMQDESNYRVLNLAVSTFNDNSTTAYFHNSIGGYHGAKMKRYQELIDSALYNDLTLFTTAANNATTVGDLIPVLSDMRIVNMLNTKYIIYNTDAPPITNENANGNAWFVEKPIIVEDANQEINLIQSIDPKREAVIDDDFAAQVTKQSYQQGENDYIKLTSVKLNEMVYDYSATEEQLVIFSEIYYPKGWECYVDGQPSDYFRADYVLRGMSVPAGKHEIKFVFSPTSYKVGTKVSYASSILLLLMVCGFLFYKVKTKGDDSITA